MHNILYLYIIIFILKCQKNWTFLTNMFNENVQQKERFMSNELDIHILLVYYKVVQRIGHKNKDLRLNNMKEGF